MTRQRKPSHPKTLARTAAQLMLEKKAQDVVIIDVRKQTDITDFFVIATGTNDTQVKAMADSVVDGLTTLGVKPWRTEGWTGRQWIVLDFVEVVVHVMYREAREFYRIERLWGDGIVEKVVDEAPETTEEE